MADPDEREPENQGQDVLQDVAEAAREYGSQVESVSRVTASADERSQAVDAALRAAFAAAIRLESLEVIDFRALTVMDLGRALESHPVILKPLLAVCNVAGRALERDLSPGRASSP